MRLTKKRQAHQTTFDIRIDTVHVTTSTKGTTDPEGARLLTYSTIGKPRLCININHYAPPRTVLQQAQRRARIVLQQAAALQLHV